MTETVMSDPQAALARLAAAGADTDDLALITRALDRAAREMAAMTAIAGTHWQDGERLRAALAATYASRSWRVTAPLREWRVTAPLRRLRGG